MFILSKSFPMLLITSELHPNRAALEAAALRHTTWQAALVTLVFTVIAWLLKGVTSSGALAGAVASFAIYLSAGPGPFLALVSVFVIAVGTTRMGYSRKQELGTAEGREGRSASQIVANVGVAALASVLFGFSTDPVFLIAGAAALAEAAADTSSSEIGQATSGQARLITTLELVPAGTNGGITISGTLAGAAASLLVAGCCVLVKMISHSAFLLVSCAGFIGMLLDSVLGALVERRGALNNDTVNLLGTFFAALIAFLVSRTRW
jgi:uncharacterized protein (TIGR00297 family)